MIVSNAHRNKNNIYIAVFHMDSVCKCWRFIPYKISWDYNFCLFVVALVNMSARWLTAHPLHCPRGRWTLAGPQHTLCAAPDGYERSLAHSTPSALPPRDMRARWPTARPLHCPRGIWGPAGSLARHLHGQLSIITRRWTNGTEASTC